jgi:hypothetical protein
MRDRSLFIAARCMALKRNNSLGKNFAELKSSNVCLANLKYQLKMNTHPWPKGYRSVVAHVLYHFYGMSLITACAILCSLKFHVVCTCTFFGDTICLLTNRKISKTVTLIDLHIVLTCDCWNCFLAFNIWVSHVLEIFIIHPSSVPTPAINNHGFLNSIFQLMNRSNNCLTTVINTRLLGRTR